MSFDEMAKPLSVEHVRLRPTIVTPGLIFRAVLFGLLFAYVFLWALPQGRFLLASSNGEARSSASVSL